MPQTDGGYLGSDFEAFFSAVVSGAAGVYIGVLLQDAGIEIDLVVRPCQRVSVSGDASLPRPPRWGGGGFTVQQRGSLTLQAVAVSGGLSVTTDSSFSASTTTLGGSVSLSNAGSVTLEDTTFAEGTELSVGGGTSLSLLSCRGQLTSLTVTDSSFSASTTTLSGSISLSNAGSVTLEDTTFAEGTELTVGGGTTLSLKEMALGASTVLRVSGGSLSLAQMAVTSAQFSALFLADSRFRVYISRFAPGSVVRLSEVTVPWYTEALTASLSVGADGVAVYDPPDLLEPSRLVRFTITIALAARLAGSRRCAGFSLGTRPRALLRRCTPTATRSADAAAALRSTAGCSTGSPRTAPAVTIARAVRPRGQGGATRRSATARRPTSVAGRAAPCCSGGTFVARKLGATPLRGSWAPATASGTATPSSTSSTVASTTAILRGISGPMIFRNLQLCRRMRRATGGASPLGTLKIKEPSTSWRGTAAAAGGARAHHRAAARCGGCCWSGERSSSPRSCGRPGAV